MACLITGREVHSSVTAEAFLSLQWDLGLGLGPNWGPKGPSPGDQRAAKIFSISRDWNIHKILLFFLVHFFIRVSKLEVYRFTDAFWSTFFQRACSYILQWIYPGEVRECQSIMLSLAFSFWMLKTSDAPPMGESFHLCPCRGNR